MPGTILVAYGTKHGSTREVADAVAETLEEHGLEVETLAGRTHRRRHAVRRRRDRRRDLHGALASGRRQLPRAAPQGAPRPARRGLRRWARGRWRTTTWRSRGRSSSRLWRRCPRSTRSRLPCSAASSIPGSCRFPFNRMPASDARDWPAIRAWAAGLRRRIRLRESRIRAEGSPQRASADAPMKRGAARRDAGFTKVRARTGRLGRD